MGHTALRVNWLLKQRSNEILGHPVGAECLKVAKISAGSTALLIISRLLFLDAVHSHTGQSSYPSLGNGEASLQLSEQSLPPSVGPSPVELEDSADSSTLLVPPDMMPLSESTPAETLVGNHHSPCSLNTIV